MNINARSDRQGFEFLSDRHNSILACGEQSGKLSRQEGFYRRDAETERGEELMDSF